MLRSCISWVPYFQKRKICILCLCSSATDANEMRRVAHTVDLILLYLKKIYDIELQNSYLVSPTGYKVLLYKSSSVVTDGGNNNNNNNNTRSNYNNVSLMDVWISTARSETLRFFKESPKDDDDDPDSSHYHSPTISDFNRGINKTLNICLNRVRYIPQLY